MIFQWIPQTIYMLSECSTPEAEPLPPTRPWSYRQQTSSGHPLPFHYTEDKHFPEKQGPEPSARSRGPDWLWLQTHGQVCWAGGTQIEATYRASALEGPEEPSGGPDHTRGTHPVPGRGGLVMQGCVT